MILWYVVGAVMIAMFGYGIVRLLVVHHRLPNAPFVRMHEPETHRQAEVVAAVARDYREQLNIELELLRRGGRKQ